MNGTVSTAKCKRGRFRLSIHIHARNLQHITKAWDFDFHVLIITQIKLLPLSIRADHNRFTATFCFTLAVFINATKRLTNNNATAITATKDLRIVLR